MRNLNDYMDVLDTRKFLYVGMNEQNAKMAPIKGLDAPVFLTDVYPGFFCKSNCINGERWGIIAICTDKLHIDMFAPPPNFLNKNKGLLDNSIEQMTKHKRKWAKSLAECGVCTYLSTVPAAAIEKIMIYNTNGKHTNQAINKLLALQPNPYEQNMTKHKSAYSQNMAIVKWLSGEEVDSQEILGIQRVVSADEIDANLHDRQGLDMYYIKADEKGRRKSARK